MSVKWMSYIWDERVDLKGAELLCAIAIADHADHDGKCFPGLAAISKKMRCSVRHVEDLIKRLQEKNVFTVESGVGRGNMTVFQFLKGEQSFTFSGEEKVNNPSPFYNDKRRTFVQEKVNNRAKKSAHIRNESFKHTQGVRVNPPSGEESTFVTNALDALRDSMGVIFLPDETLWCAAAEWCFANGFSVEQFVGCYHYLSSQAWRESAVSPNNVKNNLPKFVKAAKSKTNNGFIH